MSPNHDSAANPDFSGREIGDGDELRGEPETPRRAYRKITRPKAASADAPGTGAGD